MSQTHPSNLNRRTVLTGAAALAGAGAIGLGVGNYWLGGSSRVSKSLGKKVIVIGVDGMDPRLSESMMQAGQLPNLEKLRAAGGFSRLGTSTPPQSPVAWANFINGAGPGSHGIFDFIHRHPQEQCAPVLLGRRDAAGQRVLGGWRSSAAARLLALQSQAAPDSPPAPGDAVLGLSRRRRHPVDLLRPAFQLPCQPITSRSSPLHLRHGYARHARHVRHLSIFRRGRPGRAARRRGRQAVETDLR